MTRTDTSTHGNRERLLRYVERLALVLAESGMTRMPARVFAYILADDAERYTARELSDGLRVSPAAISGAVRYLVQVGMLGRERVPGERSDHYRIYDDDVWSAIVQQRSPLLKRWADAFAEGVEVVGEDTPGGRRLRESQRFYEFMAHDVEQIMERWRAYRHAQGFDAHPPASNT